MRRGRGFDRTQRIADQMQRILGQMLLQEMADERMRLVTITSVSVAKDLSFAKIYVSVLSEDADEIKKLVALLNSASKSLRYRLAQEIDLRVMPELKFVYDESAAQGFKISSLIDAAMNKTDKEKDK
jgi:ribosome-binding factor A